MSETTDSLDRAGWRHSEDDLPVFRVRVKVEQVYSIMVRAVGSEEAKEMVEEDGFEAGDVIDEKQMHYEIERAEKCEEGA